jgi:hypothetical protein
MAPRPHPQMATEKGPPLTGTMTDASGPAMLAIDLLLTEKRRPRAMFLCVLLGGLTVALILGAYLALSGLIRLS